MERQRGKVTWINEAEGFGFILPDADPLEVYVHKSSVEGWAERPLQVGDCVEFIADAGPKGPVAAEVRVVS